MAGRGNIRRGFITSQIEGKAEGVDPQGRKLRLK